MCEQQRGAALVDVVATAALVTIMAGVAAPLMISARDRMAGRLAAQYFAAQLARARHEAARRNATVAVRVTPAGSGYEFRLYTDGDGDGVRAGDIAAGVDMPMSEPDRIDVHFRGAVFGILQDIPAPDGGTPLDAGSDPVRFGNTSFISFHPLGSATSGTAYITDGSGQVFAVRVLGATGRVRVLSLEVGVGEWRSD